MSAVQQLSLSQQQRRSTIGHHPRASFVAASPFGAAPHAAATWGPPASAPASTSLPLAPSPFSSLSTNLSSSSTATTTTTTAAAAVGLFNSLNLSSPCSSSSPQHASVHQHHQQQQFYTTNTGASTTTATAPVTPTHVVEFPSDPLAVAAAYQSLYASGQLTGQQAQQAHVHLLRMFAAAPAPRPLPVYEECLVGFDGAYQNYCHQIISDDLNTAALRILTHVKTAQLSDPPAVARLLGKRYFCSLKEVSKVVQSSAVLLIAPDVRHSPTAHIKPVRLLQMVMAAADAAGVPYVFCLSRRGIGQVFGRDKSMSIVAIMHVDGVENEYVTLLDQAARGREMYALHRGARQQQQQPLRPQLQQHAQVQVHAQTQTQAVQHQMQYSQQYNATGMYNQQQQQQLQHQQQLHHHRQQQQQGLAYQGRF